MYPLTHHHRRRLCALFFLLLAAFTCVPAQKRTDACDLSVALARPPAACDAVTFTPDALDYVARGNYDRLCWIFATPSRRDTVCAEDFGTYTFKQSGSITLEASGSCKTLRKRVNVRVDRERELVLTADGPYCSASAPVTLRTNLPGGNWSGQGIIDPRKGIFDPGAVAVGTNRVVYTYLDGACSYFGSLDVEVVSSQEVITRDTAVCADTSPFHLYVSAAGGRWSGQGITDAERGTFDAGRLRPGTYRPVYTYRDPSGCTVAARSTIVVQDLPRIVATDTTWFCRRDTLLDLGALSGSTFVPPGGQVSWFVDSQPVDEGRLNPVDDLPAPGNYPLRVTYTSGVCKQTLTTVLSVQPLPALQLAPTEPQCETAGTYTLRANLPGGTFAGPGVHPRSGVVNLRHIEPGTYQYTYTYRAGTTCARTAATTLSVLAAPDDVGAGEDVQLCAGSQELLVLQGATPAGGTYSGPALIDSNTVDLGQLRPDSTYTYTYRITGGEGCIDSATLRLRYDAAAVASLTAPDTVCAGVPFRLWGKGSTASSYRYDFGNGVAAATPPNPRVTYPAGDTSYAVRLSVATAAGCTDTAATSIWVTAAPTAGFVLDSLMGCAPFVVALTDRSRFATSSYYLVGRDTVRRVPKAYPLPGSRRDTTVLLTQVVSNACGTDRTADTLRVRATPRAGLALDRSVGCSPFSPRLSNTTATAGRYRFDYGDGTTSTGPVPQTVSYVNGADTVARYALRLIAANGCGADTAYQTVEVLPTDVRSVILLDERRGCSPFTFSPSSGATPGATLRWRVLDEREEQLASAASTQPVFTLDSTGLYRVVLEAGGCGNQADTVVVEVLPAPEIAIRAPERVCLNERVQLTAVGTTSSALTWYFPDSTSSVLLHPVVSFDKVGLYPIRLTAAPENNLRCAVVARTEVEVLPPPRADPRVMDSLGCVPFVARFGSEEPSAGLTYHWDFGDSSEVSWLPDPVHEYATGGRYRPRLTVTDPDGCSATLAAPTITVRLPPLADFTALVDPDATVVGDVQFRNRSEGAGRFSWQFGDSSSSTAVEPLHVYAADGAYAVTLVVSNDYPGGATCSDSITQLVRPEPFGRFYVPTALSPSSGRGEARRWGAKGLGVASYELQVYSPFGQRVFVTTEVRDGIPTGRWNGTYYNDGRPVPQGSYTWRAVVSYQDGQRKNFLGTVTVVR